MKLPIFRIKTISIKSQAEFMQSFFSDFSDEKNIEYFQSLGINVEEYKTQTQQNQIKILKKCVKKLLTDNCELIIKTISNISKTIEQNYNFMISEFAKIFNINYKKKQTYTINVGVCYVCPRYLDNLSFNLNCFYSIKDNFQVILHEMTHFYWFDKIKTLYPNIDKKNFDYPNLIWLISEIAVDPILNNSRLKKFIVTPPAYSHFYTTKFNNQSIIEIFNEMYTDSKNMEEFIQKTMIFIKNNTQILKTLI